MLEVAAAQTSVSLLVLVVTGRPILASDPRLCVSSFSQWFTGVLVALPPALKHLGRFTMPSRRLLSLDLGYVHRFQLDSPLLPIVLALISPPFRCVPCIGIGLTSSSCMHSSLPIVICPRARLCRCMDPSRPSESGKVKMLPQTKVKSIYKNRIPKST